MRHHQARFDALRSVLDRYRPEGGAEIADVRRLRARLDGAGAGPRTSGTRDPAGDLWSRSAPLHVTGSAVIVHPADRRVLLRWHERQQAWLQVGGHADPGETDPLVVALREGAEETGLTDLVPWPDASIRHVAIVSVPASSREPAHEHADIRYVLATGRPGDAVPERPTAPLRWVRVAQALDLTSEANLRETLTRVGRLLDGGS